MNQKQPVMDPLVEFLIIELRREGAKVKSERDVCDNVVISYNGSTITYDAHKNELHTSEPGSVRDSKGMTLGNHASHLDTICVNSISLEHGTDEAYNSITTEIMDRLRSIRESYETK